MKEIVLNEVSYLREGVVSAQIDESQVEFHNGLAVIKATLTYSSPICRAKSYDCYGVIDENFHEAFDDKLPYARNLMFLPYNAALTRIGDSDFIASVNCGDENMSFVQNRHIRLVDGCPMMVNENIGVYQKTTNEDILIVGWKNKRLYSVSSGEFITPLFHDITQSSNSDNVFDVVVCNSSLENPKYPLSDYYFFKIDKDGIIISPILSSLTCEYISYPLLTPVADFISFASEEFAQRLSKLSTSISTLLVNNDYKTSEELKRERINPSAKDEQN